MTLVSALPADAGDSPSGFWYGTDSFLPQMLSQPLLDGQGLMGRAR
jgi:hypothetical protein